MKDQCLEKAGGVESGLKPYILRVVKRCTAMGQLEMVSWPGPSLLSRPQLRDRGSSLRASPPRFLKLRAWLPPHPQVPQLKSSNPWQSGWRGSLPPH